MSIQNIKRRPFLNAMLGLTGLSALSSFVSKSQSRKPNILYIMADDLGWADLSCYGRREYQTPNLDRLASNGVRFTNAYSASSVCTPTRVAFNTGRYPARFPIGIREPLGWKRNVGDKVGLDPAIPTVASLLKKNNYYTILIGKWHLGYLPTYSPIKSGFDDFFGVMSGGVDYFTHKDAVGDPDLFEDETPVEKAGYITDLITERAVEFINRADKPFFLSLNYTAPHWPWETDGDLEKSKTLKPGYEAWVSDGGSLETYAKMMTSLDTGVGRVMAALKKRRLDENTLVIFTSDNGGERFSYNWPFSGKKFELLEGGLRVPAIVSWKGVVPSGKVTDQVAITMDWSATILAVANSKPDNSSPLDGVDLIPFITGKTEKFERKLFWRMSNQEAVRSGKWKYYKKITKVNDCAVENEYLFDLQYDQREQSDFKEEFPDIFKNLKDEFASWNKEMLPYQSS